MDNYAWRECAGKVCDAIMFAAQMGFIERINGSWHLHLEDMIRFFGSDNSLMVNRSDGEVLLGASLWNGDYYLTLSVKPRIIGEAIAAAERSRLDLSITIKSNYSLLDTKPHEYKIGSDKRGVLFYCDELGGALDAVQLMQLLTVLSKTMDEHANWVLFE